MSLFERQSMLFFFIIIIVTIKSKEWDTVKLEIFLKEIYTQQQTSYTIVLGNGRIVRFSKIFLG